MCICDKLNIVDPLVAINNVDAIILMHEGTLFVYDGFTVSRSLFQKLKTCEKVGEEMENMKITCKFALRLYGETCLIN